MISTLLLASLLGASDGVPESAPELGRVDWPRDVDAAVAAAEADGRPVFALFQEVPG